MKTKLKIPALRFKGFTDAWEQRKLSELYNKNTEKNEELISYDKTISIATMTYKNGGNGASDKSLKAYKVLRVGDLAFEGHTNKKFKYGRFVLNDIGTGIMSPRFSTLRPIQCMPISFWKYYIHYEPIMQKILVNSTKAGTMMNELVIPEFLKQSILVPSMSEQQKIGEYLSNLDHLITLHQRKCDQTKELKKTMLQKMFPKKGECIPEIRFPEFTDEWEEKKLGEVGETFTGLSGKTKADFGHGAGKFVTYVNVFNNPISDLKGVDSIEIDDNQKQVQYGDILITTSSETPEEVGMTSVWLGREENVYLNSFCFGFRPTTELSSYYMAYALRSHEVRKKFIILAQGISRYNISKTKVMEINIPFPSLPEQEAIGTYFQTLDQDIAQIEKKLADLKELKKTLLRQLFV